MRSGSEEASSGVRLALPARLRAYGGGPKWAAGLVWERGPTREVAEACAVGSEAASTGSATCRAAAALRPRRSRGNWKRKNGRQVVQRKGDGSRGSAGSDGVPWNAGGVARAPEGHREAVARRAPRGSYASARRQVVGRRLTRGTGGKASGLHGMPGSVVSGNVCRSISARALVCASAGSDH